MAAPSAEPVSLPSPARRSLGTRAVLASGLVAAGVYLVMVTWMFWTPDFSLHQFKAFFPNDQQSYLTIAVNFAHVTHSDPVVWWWVGSLGSQALLAGVVGAAGAAFSGHRWAALLGPVARADPALAPELSREPAPSPRARRRLAANRLAGVAGQFLD